MNKKKFKLLSLNKKQEVSYSYQVNLISASDDFRTVSENDNINVSFYFYGEI